MQADRVKSLKSPIFMYPAVNMRRRQRLLSETSSKFKQYVGQICNMFHCSSELLCWVGSNSCEEGIALAMPLKIETIEVI